jgi:hypothetical protein
MYGHARRSQLHDLGDAPSPLRLPCMRALSLFSPTISTVLPRLAYLAVFASRAATVEACARRTGR